MEINQIEPYISEREAVAVQEYLNSGVLEDLYHFACSGNRILGYLNLFSAFKLVRFS